MCGSQRTGRDVYRKNLKGAIQCGRPGLVTSRRCVKDNDAQAAEEEKRLRWAGMFGSTVFCFWIEKRYYEEHS
jgi:hypothetical protein